MAWLGTIANNVLRNIVFAESPPNKVIEIDVEDYSNREIINREDGIVLYGPPKDKSNNKYEVLLHRPCTESIVFAYSLYRSQNLEDAEKQFKIFKDKIPMFVQIFKKICNLSMLQKLCDTLSLHPTWTLAHLAAYFCLSDGFTYAAVNSHLNSGDATTGESPLQVAIQTNNLQIVQLLIDSKSSLEHLDHQRNTVYHYAASSTKEIIMALGSSLPSTLNSRNCDGYTPLHLACLNDKPDCVKALLLIGADVNIPAMDDKPTSPGYVGDFLHDKPNLKLHAEDMKYGGTPLHWSCGREVINALIEKNCNVDALNFMGRTALHIMVIRKRLQCVVALLSHMASVSIPDNEGNTPLHLATSQSTPTIVQMLIGFGADLNAVNNKGETPRHLVNLGTNEGHKILYYLEAVGALRCSPNMTNCNLGCKSSENYIGITPSEPPITIKRTALDQMLHVAGMDKLASLEKKRKKGGRLLCMDGGGIRGLVLIQTLLEIESVLNKPIISCFEWVAGTSTGGILALGLAAGKSLRECQALYFRIKEEAFVGMRPYNSEGLEKVLKECLGTDTVMADITMPKLMITGVLADRKPLDLHIFRNYESPSQLLNVPVNTVFKRTLHPEEQLLWKAARASGAAPSYFRAFGRFLDGGLIANNPTLDAITEIHEYNLALKAINLEEEVIDLSLVVSLGTGLVPTIPLSDVDIFRPDSLWGTYKLAFGVSTMATLLVDQATATNGRVVDRARTWCSMIGVPYYRFNPQLSTDVAMDEKSDEVLADMIWTAKAFMHANRDLIKELAVMVDRNAPGSSKSLSKY
ncbi:85/88 kDa calcium-independent phospholipase A2-like [Prorops nasuta]|uniref:85/88 kDa calcium-independent phospholipase A2-like n=1 Tax=Prorops nasuta TaxID=863751 RepID=UPI0034CEB150